jgi:hypothetical protein
MFDTKQLKVFFQGAIGSVTLLSVLLIFVVDGMCRLGFSILEADGRRLHFDIPYRSRTWWATADFLRQNPAPDILLLGASDVTTALYSAEATFSGTPQSEILTHRSTFLENKLKELHSNYRSTFCLAIPGEMPSDAYLLANTLLKNNTKSKVIVYAVTPRCFYDATFGDPSSSDTYKVMSKLGGTRELELECRSSLWDRFDYLCRRLVSVYDHKWELTSWQHHLGQALMSNFLPVDFSKTASPYEVRLLARRELPEDFGPNEVLNLPFDPKRRIFFNNLSEYQARYQKLRMSTFNQQLSFFQKFCDLCHAEHIDLIVTNSPVTTENRALLPSGVYANYLAKVLSIVERSGGTFVDLDKPDLFEHDDFFDTVHLNGKGGQKYLDQIAQSLCQHLELAALRAGSKKSASGI